MPSFRRSDHDTFQATVSGCLAAVPAGIGGSRGHLSLKRPAVSAAATRIAFAGCRDFACALACDRAAVRGPRADRDRSQYFLRSRLLSIHSRGFGKRRNLGGETTGERAGRGPSMVYAAVSAAPAE